MHSNRCAEKIGAAPGTLGQLSFHYENSEHWNAVCVFSKAAWLGTPSGRGMF